MEYRQGYSRLGFGCLRIPADEQECERLILRAIQLGINYFDTAYTYKGNEELLGRILERNHCRDQVQIATKVPSHLVHSRGDLDRIFDRQLARLHTDRVDNYLMHMLPDLPTWNRLKSLGVVEWLEEKRQAGQIGRVGFSFHGNTDQFLELLNAYPWDFCQIQYNYMDEHTQAGRKGLEAAYQLGIPVIIMEPLRGGNLVQGLTPEARKLFDQTGRSPAEWGLTWLYAQEAVTCVLSGMNTLEMLEENVRIASQKAVFTQEDFALIERVKAAILASKRISCSACRYCMPCPAGVDIPGAFRCYNVSYSDGLKRGMKEYILTTTFKSIRSNAALCKGCGACEKKCPQHIPIREELKAVRRRLENPAYQAIALAGRFLYRGKSE